MGRGVVTCVVGVVFWGWWCRRRGRVSVAAVAERFAETADSRRKRRKWRHTAQEWTDREAKAQNAYDEIVIPEAERLDRQIHDMDDRMKEVRQHQE